MYTDDTILIAGKYKFVKLCRVPAEFLLKVYNARNKTNLQLYEYVVANIDAIRARHEGRLPTPPLELPCKKYAYISKKIANLHLSIMREKEQQNKKPIRSYECEKCGAWHLTSLSMEEWEKKALPHWPMAM